MSSIREQIVQAVLAQLNDAGKPGGLPTYERVKLDSPRIGEGFLSANVKPRESTQILDARGRPQGGAHAPLRRWRTKIEIEQIAGAAAGTSPDQAVDPLYIWTIKALVGTNLGGLAIGVEEGPTRFSYEKSDVPACLAITEIWVEHTARTTDPELKT